MQEQEIWKDIVGTDNLYHNVHLVKLKNQEVIYGNGNNNC